MYSYPRYLTLPSDFHFVSQVGYHDDPNYEIYVFNPLKSALKINKLQPGEFEGIVKDAYLHLSWLSRLLLLLVGLPVVSNANIIEDTNYQQFIKNCLELIPDNPEHDENSILKLMHYYGFSKKKPEGSDLAPLLIVRIFAFNF